VGRSTLYDLASRGLVEMVKVGRKTLVTTESLDRHIDNLPRAGIRPAKAA
jgi:hypothetical protein